MSTPVSIAAPSSPAPHDDPLLQEASPDTGLACLVMMARLHGVAADPDQLAHEFKCNGTSFSAVDI